MVAQLPLISCIIPVYNAEKYLDRCLGSVLAQCYLPLEIILIDDGSTDDSRNICDTYSGRYKNVVVRHIPNGGASLARKKGLELSKGDYVTFVDSDDYIAPNYVLELYNLIIKYGTKISACGVRRVEVDENDNDNANKEHEDYTDKLLEFDELMPRFFKYEFWGFWGGLYHRSVFDGLDFPKATLSEDYYVKTQMFCKEQQMVVTEAPLYCYEYHSESLSHTKLSERAFEEFENVKAVYDYVLNNCPEYAFYALSNVVETAVKLNMMRESSEFDSYYKPINKFLRDNKEYISKIGTLNKNVKSIAKGLTISPCLTRFFAKLFIGR